MKQIDVRKTILDNGLSVVTAFRESEIFSLGFGVKVGSLYESEEKSGISHMVEHMLFKGTKTRSREKLNDDIEALAGDLDIYTTYHQTVMTLDVMKSKGRDSLEIVSDMVMNAAFPEKEFRLERRVITEEIKMSKDDTEDLSYLGLYKAAFPESWFKYNITGTIKSVKSLKALDLVEFYNKYYLPGNCSLCIVSSFTHEEVLEMVKEYFGVWEGGSAEELKEELYSIVPRKVRRRKKGISQTHLLYAFDIQGLNRREEVALALLNEKIGAGANSVLFKELRDKKGYAYSVYSSIDMLKNLKMFYIYAGISEENLGDTMRVIDEVVSECRENYLGINEKNIRLIKDMFITHTAIALESSSHISEYLLDGELERGNPEEYHEALQIMEEITLEDIKMVIKKVFSEPIIHIISPDK